MSSIVLTELETEPVAAQESAGGATWYAFRTNPMGVAALALMLALLLVGLAAPLLAAYPSGFTSDVLQPPSTEHWFGTDNLGRDVFAEVVWGTRISMTVGVCASLLAISMASSSACWGRTSGAWTHSWGWWSTCPCPCPCSRS